MTAEQIVDEARRLYTVHQGDELPVCLNFLLQLQTQRPIAGFIEVGSANGGSFHCWSRVILQGPKVSVDWNQGFGMGPSEPDRVSHEVDHPIVQHRNALWRAHFTDVRIVEGNSLHPQTVEACKTALAGEQVDWLFIDADHRYAEALQDFMNYSQFVSPGGYVGFHDIYMTSMQMFWNDMKQLYAQRYKTNVWEFPIKQLPTQVSLWYGIGVIQLRSSHQKSSQ